MTARASQVEERIAEITNGPLGIFADVSWLIAELRAALDARDEALKVADDWRKECSGWNARYLEKIKSVEALTKDLAAARAALKPFVELQLKPGDLMWIGDPSRCISYENTTAAQDAYDKTIAGSEGKVKDEV